MKTSRSPTLFVCAIWAFAAAGESLAAGDAARGAKAFQACAACHSVTPGEHLTGPSLAHVWGQKAATAEGFIRYSEALKKSGVTWTDKSLDEWLANPERLVPGNTMMFPGIKDPSARQDLVAYLKAISEGKAPAATAKGGSMMMGRAERPHLKKAGADAQVVALTHCRDTYTVKTANGATHKIWEFNLRLKTDSSEYGPVRGKPVITGSGMMGDRASVVFASPEEISSFVKKACDND